MEWLQKHMIVTVLLVIWILGLVSWVTYRVFSPEPPTIPSTTVAALGTVYGLPMIAVGLWKWRGELMWKGRKGD